MIAFRLLTAYLFLFATSLGKEVDQRLKQESNKDKEESKHFEKKPTSSCIKGACKAQGVFSIQDALKLGYNYNVNLVGARNQVNLQSEDMVRVRGEWLPTLSARVSQKFDAGKFNVDLRAPEALTEGAPASDRREVLYTNKHVNVINPRASLTLSQNVYSGGETLSKGKKSHSHFEQSIFGVKKTEQSVFLNIVNTYVAAARLYEEWAILKKREKILSQIQNHAALRYELGDHRMADMALAKARTHKVTIEVNGAYRKFEDARNALRSYTGYYIPWRLSFPDMSDRDLPFSLDQFMKLALDNNPILKEMEAFLAASRSGIGIARAGLKPKVDVSASLDYRNNTDRNRASNQDWSSFRKDRGVSRSVDVNFSWNLFTGGRQQSACRSAELDVYGARLKQEEAKRSIIQQCRSAYLKYQTCRKNLASARAAYSQNLAALKASNDEYVAGSTSMMDLLGIEQQYTIAILQLIHALSECALSYYECQALIGRMDASGLGLDVKLFDVKKYQKDHLHALFGLGSASKKTLFSDGKDSDSFPLHDQCQDQFMDTGCENCSRSFLDLGIDSFSLTAQQESKTKKEKVIASKFAPHKE
jgi:outer membrane protein TolC